MPCTRACAGCGFEHKLGLAVLQVHTTGRSAHHPDRLLSTEQAAGPGSVQLTDAAGRPKGNQKVLIFLQCKTITIIMMIVITMSLLYMTLSLLSGYHYLHHYHHNDRYR